MTFTHVLTEPVYLTAPDDEGRQYVLLDGPDKWRPFTIAYRPYVTPLSEIPAALGGTAS